MDSSRGVQKICALNYFWTNVVTDLGQVQEWARTLDGHKSQKGVSSKEVSGQAIPIFNGDKMYHQPKETC